jgi:signal peptidase II
MARRVAGWLFMLMVLALVGCDGATKAAAEATLRPSGPVSLLKGVLELAYVQNHETAFSLSRYVHVPGKPFVLAAVALAATFAIAVAAYRRRAHASSIEQLATALIVAGAAGNLLDRLRKGYVVDFIHLEHWPVFNVADVLVAAGGILLAWSWARGRRAPA